MTTLTRLFLRSSRSRIPSQRGRGKSVVDEERVESQADDINSNGDQEHIDSFDQPHGKRLGRSEQQRALMNDVDRRHGYDAHLVDEQGERRESRANDCNHDDEAAEV